MTLPDPAWRDWYRAQHDRRCALLVGQAYEDYVTKGLGMHHPDFFNPDPTGTLGDGGCDGLAQNGEIFYACYGSRAAHDTEAKLAAKLRNDLDRVLDQFPYFKEWRFVTNARLGPLCATFLAEEGQKHQPGSDRPLILRVWRPDDLWSEVIGKLEVRQLNDLFPGVPSAANLELEDLIPLIDTLGSNGGSDSLETIRPVSFEKMLFNQLPQSAHSEFNVGRTMAPRIDQWFAQQEADLRDMKASNFKGIYETARRATSVPVEILERVYTALGGANFRLDLKRANAVYAVTAYFFDSCDIFEEPPATSPGVNSAAAN